MLAAPSAPQALDTVTSCILVAETDPDARSQLQDHLHEEHRLIFAQHGTTILARLKEHLVDLVLLDVSLPGNKTLDLLRQIRGVSASVNVPVILIAGRGDRRTVLQGLRLGAKDYITKPFDAEVLCARVDTQIALRRAEVERRRTLEQLKLTQEMQENFTRIVSHDLKGPLTNIRMAQYVLRDILRDNTPARSILDNMDMTLKSMSDMIHVFLDAMDSQQLEPKLKPLHSHDLIVEVIDEYRLAADSKAIQLEMRDSGAQVLADPDLLRQVIGNLVSNALKFSPPDRQVCIWTEARKNRVRIYVADQGPGILPEERGRLFAMFGKLSARPTGGESSTGLGLWIVRQLTELQGGRVGVDQPEAGGSAFWIELPSAKLGA